MYISKFSSFNFRSLKEVVIRLENGKNVIVGKNNSGKSNIIKGIEILIGERFPSYINFSANDFYTYEEVDASTGELKEVVSDNFYLEVELAGRDIDVALINGIKKSTAFSKVKKSGCLYEKLPNGEIKVNYDLFQSIDEIENRPEVEKVDGKVTHWKKHNELVTFLKESKTIKIFFSKSRRDEEKIGFGLICYHGNGYWISHYLSKKLRDALITTTVISALRSQKEDLRLVHYTWFGKLILNLWQKNKSSTHPTCDQTYEELLKERSSEIKTLVDEVFEKDTKEIRRLLEGAIAHKSISFRFLNDSTNELYKNIQLFVNDGIDRPLHEKGTGIQSAIIISLFSLYCNEFHNNSSLLIAEEPELFLHPQARRVISAELDKFLKSCEDQPRQLIISTHSIEYLKNVDPYNIVRVYKDSENNCSIAKQISFETSQGISLELKRFLWSNNTELFFADKVVLVEGGEVFLIPSIVDKIKGSKQLLDYENISISRVNGKGSFLIYIKMLQCFNIPFVLLGDLDCFKGEVSILIKHLNIEEIKDSVGAIKAALNKLPINFEGISERVKNVDKNYNAQKLQNVFEKFNKGTITNDDEELQTIIQYMQTRYTKGNKVEAILKSVGEENFNFALSKLRENNIFIWAKGELEDYYSAISKKNLSGKSKDIDALSLSYLLQEDDQKLEDLILHLEEINVFVDIILTKPVSVKVVNTTA